MSPLLYVPAVIVLVLFALGGYVFYAACRRQREPDWLDALQLKGTPREVYHQAAVDSARWLREHRAQDVSILSAEGLRLWGKWIPAENAKGTVLMAHGYRSTMLIDCHLGFELFHRLGLNILAPQQRCHGQSGGKYITFGVRESEDMERWIEHLNAEFQPGPIVLFGISMGASTMLYLADRALPSNVKAIIADCGFTSPADIIAVVYKSVTHLPAGPVLRTASVWARIFAGFSLWECDSRKALKDSRLPVLLVHGRADSFVPCRMSQAAYDACTGPMELLLVENAEHGLSFVADGLAYTASVIEFLNKYAEKGE